MYVKQIAENSYFHNEILINIKIENILILSLNIMKYC